MTEISRKTLGRIWSLVRSVGMTKDEFYSLLEEHYAHRHLHDLTRQELGELMDNLSRSRRPGGRITAAQEELIRQLAARLVRDPENLQNYILAVCRDVARKDGLRFCEPRDAVKIVEALKAACRRKGV